MKQQILIILLFLLLGATFSSALSAEGMHTVNDVLGKTSLTSMVSLTSFYVPTYSIAYPTRMMRILGIHPLRKIFSKDSVTGGGSGSGQVDTPSKKSARVFDLGTLLLSVNMKEEGREITSILKELGPKRSDGLFTPGIQGDGKDTTVLYYTSGRSESLFMQFSFVFDEQGVQALWKTTLTGKYDGIMRKVNEELHSLQATLTFGEYLLFSRAKDYNLHDLTGKELLKVVLDKQGVSVYRDGRLERLDSTLQRDIDIQQVVLTAVFTDLVQRTVKSVDYEQREKKYGEEFALYLNRVGFGVAQDVEEGCFQRLTRGK